MLLLELKDCKNSIWLPKHMSFHVFMPFQAPCGVPAGLLLLLQKAVSPKYNLRRCLSARGKCIMYPWASYTTGT